MPRSAPPLRRLAVALMAVGMLVVGASAPAATAADKHSDSDLSTDWRVAFNDDIDYQANIFASFDTTPYFIFTEVYDTLLNYDIPTGAPDLKHSPATSYHESKDGLTITYHLRPGMRWSDGKPFTSADVAFSFRLAPHSIVNSDYTTNVKSVNDPTPTTFVIHMKKPDARILTAFVPIVPQHIWKNVPLNALNKFNPCCPMVGSGPFYVKSLNPQGTSVLVPNPYFYGPKGHIKRILLIRYQDEEAELRDLKLGNVDAINIGRPTWVDELRSDPEVHVWSTPAVGFNEVAFNSCPPTGSPICTGPAPGVHVKVVQDLAIRHAMQWAIDRDVIAREVWKNQAIPGGGLISPAYESRGYFKDWSKDPNLGYRYDPAKARQVLKDGGWNCPPGGICTKNGTKAEFTLMVLSDAAEDQLTALRMQAWARAVGIKIDIRISTEDAIDTAIYNTTDSKKPGDSGKYEPTYDAFMWSWGGDIATPDYNFEVMTCTNWSADAQWCNHTFSKLTSEALTETDFKKRVELLHEAEKIELEQSPYVIYAYTPYISVTRTDTWKNYQPTPTTVDGKEGQPFGESWAQLQLVQPGRRTGNNYAGTAWVIAFMTGVVVVLVAIGWYRRRREEHQPFELPPASPEPSLP